MKKKLFGTDGIRGVANEYPMIPEVVLLVGKALSLVLAKRGKRSKVLIGKDTRISGYIFEMALTSGLCSMGVDVYLVGPMPTPALPYLVKKLDADAGIMISASHNPAPENGIKVFDRRGYKLGDSFEQKIEDSVLNGIAHKHVPADMLGKAYRIYDADSQYLSFIKSNFKKLDLGGLKIIVDCANGSGYKIAPPFFSELGAEIIAINNKPDGLNILKKSGVFHSDQTARVVLRNKADLGIVLDGDADRLLLIDEKGKLVDGDGILAITALSFKEAGMLKNNSVVTTAMANQGFLNLMKKNNIKVIIAPVGDKHVLDQMKKKKVVLGGEQCGHIIFSKFGTTSDSILTATQVLALMKEKNKRLSELAAGLKKYPQKLINICVKEKIDFKKLHSVQRALVEADNLIGGKGRVVIRYSGTEDIARVMVEASSAKVVNKTTKLIAEAIKKEIGR